MARGMENLRLRWPKPLRDKIAAEAEKAGRSINSEILLRLGLTLEPQYREMIAEFEEMEAIRERQDQESREKFEQLMQDPNYRERMRRIIAKMEPKPQYRKKD